MQVFVGNSRDQRQRSRPFEFGVAPVEEMVNVTLFGGQRARIVAVAALVAATGFLATAAEAATLVGYFPGNDPFGGREQGLYGTFNGTEISSPSLAKCDVDGVSCHWENGAVAGEDYTGAFGIGFDSGKSGTWSFAANPSLTHAPAYLAVKAAQTWALYSLDGKLGGNWSTLGLMTPNGKNQADVSHLSFYNSVAPIPLPAAAWLLITALGGLGALSWRRGAA